MRLLVDKTGEQFLQILDEFGDVITVQFISNEGIRKGKPFTDSMAGLFLTGWKPRATSTAIGLERFKQGKLEDPKVSYANTHADGYYMYVRIDTELKHFKITPEWVLLPSQVLLALPFYPAPKTQQEIDNIDEFDSWAGGF